MFFGIRAVAAATVLLSFGAFGQVRSDKPVDEIRITGRLAEPTGEAIPSVSVTFGELKGSSIKRSKVLTDAKGMFAFSAEKGALYQLWLTTADMPFSEVIHTMEIVGGQDVALGDIVLEYSPSRKPIVQFSGPIQIKDLHSASAASGNLAQGPNATTIAAIYITCSVVSDEQCGSGAVHIVLGDGSEVQPPTDKKAIHDMPQRSVSLPLISEDKRAAGWLVEYDNCCTSYPLALGLTIYRPGKPLRNIVGECPGAIWNWHFEAGGKQVATYSNFPHGDYSGCYELRDAETGRQLGIREGDSTSKTPAWVKRFDDESNF